MKETLFYVFGIALAVSAVVFSFIGLKSEKFPGKAFPLVVLWFVVLAGGATTFAVLHAQEEQEHKEAEFEHAGKEIEKEQTSGPFEEEEAEQKEGGAEGGGEEAEGGGAASGAGGKLAIAADESALAYDTDSLEVDSGSVEIDFNNPSSIGHDFDVESEGGEEVVSTEVISQSEESATAELKPGTYTFYCSVPGHREAGMEGTLTVK
ncbi:MAG TPA: plastocyanin/azurin family copper-binding protein [Solirubrobacterales bacterium]|jgi:plastocyanin|nr:plastocyanin/azurin family copper-binding protein [Solirubrobacterales bacterium]